MTLKFDTWFSGAVDIWLYCAVVGLVVRSDDLLVEKRSLFIALLRSSGRML